MASLPGYAYNRVLRKSIHILAGLPAFALKFMPYPLIVLFAAVLFVFSLFLRPSYKILSPLVKEEDRRRGYIAGARNYFLTVFILCLFFAIYQPYFAIAGWLALAWGDGFAGLVGRKESVKVPWSKVKTLPGFISCLLFVFAAVIIAYLWAGVEGNTSLSLPLLLYFGFTSLIVAILESMETVVDDNFVVGIATSLLLLLYFTL